MLKEKQLPDDNGADGSSSSKQSVLVRVFFFLSVLGNLGTMYRSVVLESGEHSHSQGNDLSFLPPRHIKSDKGTKNQKKTKDGKLTSKRIPYKPNHPRVQPLPSDLKHFLSHIPKTGAEYAALELAKLFVATIPLPGNKSIDSIRTAQIQYNKTLWNHKNYNEEDPEWLYFHKNSRNHDHTNPASDAYAPPLVCNQGAEPLDRVSPFHFGTRHKNKTKVLKFYCHLSVLEYPWNNRARNVYTIVRDPVSHAVSQYFHCVDSHQHVGSELMPPIGDWLDAYTELSDSLPLESRPPYTKSWKGHPEALELRNKFMCYNPIDSESDYVQFPAIVKGERLVLPKDYTYPYPQENAPPRDKKTQQLDRKLFDDLKKRFRVIGDMAQMIKTVCAIFIDMTDGEHIPTPCDCTHWDETKKNQHSSLPTFKVPNLYQTNQKKFKNAAFWYIRPYVELGYNSTKHTHGVKTRGSHFAKEGLTAFQKTKIEHLRPLDALLYNISRAIFDEQVSVLEDSHGIKICDDSFNREGEIDWEKES